VTAIVVVAIAERGRRPNVDDALAGVETFPLTERGLDALVAHLRARMAMPSVVV
jgi:hypothetical protein